MAAGEVLGTDTVVQEGQQTSPAPSFVTTSGGVILFTASAAGLPAQSDGTGSTARWIVASGAFGAAMVFAVVLA
jgi:hypothetical protein